jgi:hypothetical protein
MVPIMATWVQQWESSAWLGQVDAWVTRVLTTYEVERTGPLTRHNQSLSSTVFTAPTQAGSVYVKAPAPLRRGEAEVVALAAPHSDGHLVAPLAVEPSEGWLLTPATGTSLADSTRAARRRGDHSLPLTARVLADAAATQHAFLDLSEELDRAGLLVRLMPVGLAPGAQVAVEAHASLPDDHPLSLTAEDARALLKGLPRVERAAETLMASTVPQTLVPSALSLSDILVPSSKRAPVAFLGWGAARWTHPFSWVAPLIQEASLRSDEAELSSAVEAYLDAFVGHGSPDELAALFGPAESLATLQQHQDLMELLLAAEPADQAAGAPEAFRLLREIFGEPDPRPRRRH